MGSNFRHIGPQSTKLGALERFKYPHILGVPGFYTILINLACNNDMHTCLDELEFLPDRTIDYNVSCPLGS